MSTEIVPVERRLVPVSEQLAVLDDQVRLNLSKTRAENTHRARASDLRAYRAFVVRLGLSETDPITVARYLAQLDTEGAATATIMRRASSIRTCLPETDHPAVTAQLDGIRRGRAAEGKNRQHQAPAIGPVELSHMVHALPSSLVGLRTRVLLLLGFAGGFREAELVSIQADDLTPDVRGLVVTLRQTKTDQLGEGRVVAIPFGAQGLCPVAAAKAWLIATGIVDGPLLRSVDRHGRVGASLTSNAVDGIVQRAAAAAGLQQRFTGHSLRSGLVTAAFDAGVPEADIMRQTGHRSVATLRRYRRVSDAWQGNAAAVIFDKMRKDESRR